jgi:hypothetical protein
LAGCGRFRRESSILRRVDYNGTPNTWRLVWSTDINSIPGEDPVLPSVVVAVPVLCVGWFFTAICGF